MNYADIAYNLLTYKMVSSRVIANDVIVILCTDKSNGQIGHPHLYLLY